MSMNELSLALLISSSNSLLLAFSRFLIIANTKSETATIHMIMVSKLFIIQTLYRWYGKSIDKFSYSNHFIAQRYEYILKKQILEAKHNQTNEKTKNALYVIKHQKKLKHVWFFESCCT